jgi:DNA-binding SARP family transcriptional activator
MNEIALSLFGTLQITLNGKPIRGFDSNKVRALFVFLAVEANQPHRRDALAELFWPDKPEGVGRNSLRQSLANLRKILGDHDSETPLLISSRDQVQFNTGSSCTIDIVEFQEMYEKTRNHAHEELNSCIECKKQLERATLLYTGDFLEQFYLPDCPAFEEWAIRYREKFQRQMSEVLRGLISIQEKQDNLQKACENARKLIDLEPWSEGNHRLLMRMLAMSGNRSAALKQFHTCQQILATELRVDPAKETVDLYEQIKEWELGIPSKSDLIAPLVEEGAPMIGPESGVVSRSPISIWIRGLLVAAVVLLLGYSLNYAVSSLRASELGSLEQSAIDRTTSTPTSSQVLPAQESPLYMHIAGDGYEIGKLLYMEDFTGSLPDFWWYDDGQDPWLTADIDERSVLVASTEQAYGMDVGEWHDHLAQFDFYLSKPNAAGFYSLHVSTMHQTCSPILNRPNSYSMYIAPEGIHFDRNACDSNLHFSLDNPYSVSPREWHTLQIFNYRDKYRVVLDDVEIFNIIIDHPLESGLVQFLLDFGGEYYLDHFRIYKLIPSER